MNRVGKFKIGDLIQLSDYGYTIIRNSHMIWEKCAIIVAINHDNPIFPIEVKWLGVPEHVLVITSFWCQEIKIFETLDKQEE